MRLPTRSEGTRSGVNWMRWKVPHRTSATAFTVSVLARPGTPSMRRWPPERRATRTRSSRASCPTMTRLISNISDSKTLRASAVSNGSPLDEGMGPPEVAKALSPPCRSIMKPAVNACGGVGGGRGAIATRWQGVRARAIRSERSTSGAYDAAHGVAVAENSIIALIGKPGVGKFTIGSVLAQMTGARLVDNHSINNVIFNAIAADGVSQLPPEIWVQVGRVRAAVLETVATIAPRHLSF